MKTLTEIQTEACASGIAKLGGGVPISQIIAELANGVSFVPPVPPTGVSASDSTVVASPTTVDGDGVSESTVTVTLLTAGLVPVSGKTVTLESISGPSPTITTVQGVTDVLGEAIFTVKNITSGSNEFQATDTTDSIVIIDTATVTFSAVLLSDISTYWALDTASGYTTVPDSIGSLPFGNNPLVDNTDSGALLSVDGIGGTQGLAPTLAGASSTETMVNINLYNSSFSFSFWIGDVNFLGDPQTVLRLVDEFANTFTIHIAASLDVYYDDNPTEITLRTSGEQATEGGFGEHIVLVFELDGGGPFYNVMVYHEGINISTFLGISPHDILGSIVDANLSCESDGFATPLKDFRIDEFGIWNRALSASDVTALWNSGSGLTFIDL